MSIKDELQKRYNEFFKLDEYEPKIEKLASYIKNKKIAIEIYQALSENLFTWRYAAGIVSYGLYGNSELYTCFYCSGNEGCITRRANRILKRVDIVLIKNYTWNYIYNFLYIKPLLNKYHKVLKLILKGYFEELEKLQQLHDKIQKRLKKRCENENKRKK